MPQEIEDKLIWLFIILPGFLSTTIIGQIVDLGQLTEFQLVFYSFVLTMVNVSIALFIYWLPRLLRRAFSRKQSQGQKSDSSFSKGLFCSVVILVSVSTGILIGWAAEKDVFFVTLRALPITDTLNKRSSSRPLVFLLSQNASGQLKEEGDARPKHFKKTEAWVKARLKSGKEYEGWPEYFGIGDETSELYLSPACEWDSKWGKRALEPVPGPGIIIFEREIETLTFVDREESSCYAHWFGGANQTSEAKK
jgi:hypothetical protein